MVEHLASALFEGGGVHHRSVPAAVDGLSAAPGTLPRSRRETTIRRATTLLATVLVAACGGGTGTTSSTSATTGPTTTTTIAAPTWFEGLAPGACFDDVLVGDSFDFSVPAAVVPCEGPHDNEIADMVDIDAGPGGAYPGEEAADADANAKCDSSYEAFLGRPLEDTNLLGYIIFPSESDWASGSRQAVCAVYAQEPLVGSAGSGSLIVPGGTLAVLYDADGVLGLWLMDAGTGELTMNLTADFDGTLLASPATWATDGTVVAFSAKPADASPGNESDLFLASTEGLGIVPLFTGEGGEEDRPVIGPVGTVVAFISNAEGGEFEIYVVDLENEGAVTRLTDNEDRDAAPAWSPDGSQIAFRRRVGSNSDIFVMNADGSNLRRLTDDPAFDGDPHWSPDGSEIVFASDRAGNFDIWVMSADGSNQSQVTDHPADDEYPWWSPDGEYIAFQSDRHGVSQIWVMRWDGSDVSLLADDAPTGYPTWGP